MPTTSTTQTFSASIPVVDLRDFRSRHRRKIFLRDFEHALRTVGFIAIVNADIAPAKLDRGYAASKAFFLQDEATKLQANDPNLSGQRGYVPSERAQGQAAKDCKEFFHVSRNYPETLIQEHGYPHNVWPADAEFKQATSQLINEIDLCSGEIEQAISLCLGQNADFITNMTKHGDFLLRTLHYPANPPPDTVWAAAHTDIDLFTILPRATAEGLQVQNAQGEWVDVIVPDGAIIINAGDMLRNLSNGVFKSAVHRVVSKGPAERYSMVAFYHARPGDSVAPLPKFVQEVGARKYAKVTERELLFERLIDLNLHSPALLKFFAESGAVQSMQEVGQLSPRVFATLQAAGYFTEPAAKAAMHSPPAKRARPAL
jgi:isopenicillin N synthase-like dioxygenase